MTEFIKLPEIDPSKDSDMHETAGRLYSVPHAIAVTGLRTIVAEPVADVDEPEYVNYNPNHARPSSYARPKETANRRHIPLVRNEHKK